MLWALLALAFYLSPLGLIFWFEVFALGRRLGLRWLQAVGLIGLPSDWFNAAVTLRWIAPGGSTVTSKAETGSRAARAALQAGAFPTFAQAFALALAVYLNFRDPGHVELEG